MEDIDGGLHPAVDGQSLDEDEDEEGTKTEKYLFPKVLRGSMDEEGQKYMVVCC